MSKKERIDEYVDEVKNDKTEFLKEAEGIIKMLSEKYGRGQKGTPTKGVIFVVVDEETGINGVGQTLVSGFGSGGTMVKCIEGIVDHEFFGDILRAVAERKIIEKFMFKEDPTKD